MRNARAVKSQEFTDTWFLAADVEASGVWGQDDIAVWATGNITGGGWAMWVNDMAHQFSDIGSAEKERFDRTSDEVRAAINCVRSSF